MPAKVPFPRFAVNVSTACSPFHRVANLHGWSDKTARDRCYAALGLLCELIEAARALGRHDQVAGFIRPLDDLLAAPADGADLDDATLAAAEADAEEDAAEAAWAHERRRHGKASVRTTVRFLRARARCHDREKTMNLLAARDVGLHA